MSAAAEPRDPLSNATARPSLAFVNQAWNPAVPPVTTGSVAIWVYEVARRLTSECDVTVHSRAVAGEPQVRIADGVRYRRHSNWPTPFGPLGRLLLAGGPHTRNVPDVARRGYFAAYHRRVAAAIARDHAQIVHVHNLGQAACAVRRADAGVRTILHMHCEWLSQLPREFIRDWIEHSDMIVGCSEYLTRTIADAWPSAATRCATLYNGVDIAAFAPSGRRRTLGGADDEIILFVGRVTPEKGLHVLIGAFAYVVPERPNARLVIVGPESITPLDYLAGLSDDTAVARLARFYPGSYLSALRGMLHSEWADRVTFAGALSHDALPELYRGAHVLVNPSLSESFGMTVLEAMACGVPAIVTAVGGMPEVVDFGRRGAIVPPDAPEPLAEAIVRLLDDGARRAELGAASADFVRRRFSWERIARDALDLYRRVAV